MTVDLVISLPKIPYIYGSGQPNLSDIHRVGQNRIYTPYMTVDLVISLPKDLCRPCIFDKPYRLVCQSASCACTPYLQGWPEPYIYTVYGGIFGGSLPKTPYIYGSGHLYIFV